VYEGVAFDVVHDLHVVDPAADTTLLAAFTEGGGSGGVLRSITGGASWVPSSTGLSATAQCNSLSASSTTPGAIYVSNSESVSQPGVYRSTDGGQSWTATGFTGAVTHVVADQHLASTLYIATNDAPRVKVSIDDGASFTPYDAGLAAAGFVRDLRPSSGTAAQILLAANTGSFVTDAGFAPMWLDLGFGLPGSSGVPVLDGDGTLVATTPFALKLGQAKPSALAGLFLSLANTPTSFKGGTLVTVPVALTLVLATTPAGTLLLSTASWPAGLPSGTQFFTQCAVQDAGAVKGVALSNALQATTP
jgi:hypothetical protein